MTTKKQAPPQPNGWMWSTIILAVLLLLSLVWTGYLTMTLVQGNFATGQATPPPTAPGQQAPPPSAAPEIDLAAAHTLGNPDAPVVMVEYSSFTCPFCGRFHAETYDQIKSTFVDTGDVLYVYRHFPRNNEDIRIANFAECAAEQDAFFEFVDLIYENQQSIQDANLRAHAGSLGLDLDAFDSCVASGRHAEVAQAHSNEARQVGVGGTPTFFVNDNQIVGAQPYSVFDAAIRAEI